MSAVLTLVGETQHENSPASAASGSPSGPRDWCLMRVCFGLESNWSLGAEGFTLPQRRFFFTSSQTRGSHPIMPCPVMTKIQLREFVKRRPAPAESHWSPSMLCRCQAAILTKQPPNNVLNCYPVVNSAAGQLEMTTFPNPPNLVFWPQIFLGLSALLGKPMQRRLWSSSLCETQSVAISGPLTTSRHMPQGLQSLIHRRTWPGPVTKRTLYGPNCLHRIARNGIS